MEQKNIPNSLSNPEKNKDGAIILSVTKLHGKVRVTVTAWCWYKFRHIDQQNKET